MEEKFVIDEEKHIEILDAFLGDADLMVAVNECKTFEEGYELVAQKIPGLTLEEFTQSMDLLRQVVMAQMAKQQDENHIIKKELKLQSKYGLIKKHEKYEAEIEQRRSKIFEEIFQFFCYAIFQVKQVNSSL